METGSEDFRRLIDAAVYASQKHALQRRKGHNHIPYINHLLKVCQLIAENAPNPETDVLIAALLHDVLEDTDTSSHEVENLFGERVKEMVLQMTDDNSKPEEIRKEEQVLKAPGLWPETKMLKIADKIANIYDIIHYPIDWPVERKVKYITWSKRVVEGCRGVNQRLEDIFDRIVDEALQKIGSST